MAVFRAVVEVRKEVKVNQMTFSTYMHRNYSKDNSSKGELAKIISKIIDAFPIMYYDIKLTTWYDCIDAYLTEHYPDKGLKKAFKECWHNYEKDECAWANQLKESGMWYGKI